MTWFTYAVLGAFLTSLSFILEKKTLERVHSIDFAAALAFCAGLITLPVLFTSSWERMSFGILMLIFGGSLLAALAFVEVTKGVRHMEISTSSPLFLTGPMITTILAFIFLGEKLATVQLLGMLLLLIGTYVLETKHFFRLSEFTHNLLGDKYTRLIMLGLLLYGFSSLVDRVVLARWGVAPMLYVALTQLFIAFHFLVLTLFHRNSIAPSLSIIRTQWKSILLIAILTCGYRIMNAHAQALAAVGLVAAVKRSSSLFTTIIGGELFHDKNLLRKSFACLIMIAGVYLIVL